MRQAQKTAVVQQPNLFRRAFVAVAEWRDQHSGVNSAIRLATCRFPQERAQGVNYLAKGIQAKKKLPLLDFISNPENKARSQLILMLCDGDEKVRLKAVSEVKKLKLNNGDLNMIETNLLYPLSEQHIIALLDSLDKIKEPKTISALIACADKWLDAGNERILNNVSKAIAAIGPNCIDTRRMSLLAAAFIADPALHTREARLADVVLRYSSGL